MDCTLFQVSKSREENLFRNQKHWSTPNLNHIPIENFRKITENGNLSPVGVVAPRQRNVDEGLSPEIMEKESYKKRIPGYKEAANGDLPVQLRKKKIPDGTMKLSPQERFLDAKTKFLLLEKERLAEQEMNLQNFEKKRHSQVELPISPEIIRARPQWAKEDRISPGKSNIVRRNSFFDDEPVTKNVAEIKG